MQLPHLIFTNFWFIIIRTNVSQNNSTSTRKIIHHMEYKQGKYCFLYMTFLHHEQFYTQNAIWFNINDAFTISSRYMYMLKSHNYIQNIMYTLIKLHIQYCYNVM